MKVTLFIRSIASYPLYFLKKARMWFPGEKKALILMYHRVINKHDQDALIQEGMYVDVKTFGEQIQYLMKHFDIVPLDTCIDAMKGENTINNKKSLCTITFDDGWKDFYDNAFDILKYYKTFATVFLPTAYIGTKKQFWTDMLAKTVAKMNNRNNGVPLSTNHMVKRIENIKGPVQTKFEYAIDLLKNIPLEEIENILIELGKRWRVDFNNGDRTFLSWKEVREMEQSGYVRFGSHTKSHKILTTISDDMVQEELLGSRKKLIDEGVVNTSFIPFAYPNGNYNDRIAKMVEAAGYNAALTTNNGWNSIKNNHLDIYKLNRVGIHQDMTSTNAMFACRIHGIY